MGIWNPNYWFAVVYTNGSLSECLGFGHFFGLVAIFVVDEKFGSLSWPICAEVRPWCPMPTLDFYLVLAGEGLERDTPEDGVTKKAESKVLFERNSHKLICRTVV